MEGTEGLPVEWSFLKRVVRSDVISWRSLVKFASLWELFDGSCLYRSAAGGRDQIRDVNRLRGIKFDTGLFQRIEAF